MLDNYTFLLDAITLRDIPYSAIRTAAGLASKWNPLRFWVMNETKSAGVLELLGSHRSIDRPAHNNALVLTVQEVRQNLITFNTEASSVEPEEIQGILSHTRYWIYDVSADLFAPSKFLGSNPFDGVDHDQWQFVPLVYMGGQVADAKVPKPRPTLLPSVHAVAAAIKAAVSAGDFRPESLRDARDWVIRAIVRRRGQPGFRKLLLAAYEGRCAITGCDAVAALEAAHILPYRGLDTNHPTNGILLRSDIHTLFDLGLLTIDPHTLTVLLAPELLLTSYAEYAGRKLRLPTDPSLHPNPTCLHQHRTASRVLVIKD